MAPDQAVTDLAARVRDYVAGAVVIAGDGLTWREFGDLAVSLARLVIQALDAVSTMTGAQKREATVQAVGMLFDAVADKAVPTALWPIWILARPAIRSLVLSLVAGAVEPLLGLVRAAA